MQLLSKTRTILVLRPTPTSPLSVVIAIQSNSREGKSIQTLPAITSQPQQHPQPTLQATHKTIIEQQHVVYTHELKCHEQGNRITISHEDNRRLHTIIADLNEQVKLEDDDEQDGEGQSDEEDQSEEQQEQGNNGMRIKIEEDSGMAIKQYRQESSNNNQLKHRGRGRPKGAKNKKTIIKEALQLKEPTPLELRMPINSIKRGKGRPKGSKNKSKDLSQPIKIEEGPDSVPFGKRGKGRPKGSKNKIKLLNQSIMDDQQDMIIQKRKGRPPGSKNRVNSEESISGDVDVAEQFVRLDIERPSASQVQRYVCCQMCQQRSIKRRIFQSQTNVQQNLEVLKNVEQDIGLQNKGNLIVAAISIGDWQSLQQLLSLTGRIQQSYQPPWNCTKMIEKGRFQSKTKKEFLSKTGKEGNIVLFHDSHRRKSVWWKQIGIERIIDNLPRDAEAQRILQVLWADPQLKSQMYNSLSSIIRSGNFLVAQLIMREMMTIGQLNRLKFAQQHYNLLTGNMHAINHLKKFNLLQHNQGKNYCSPVHAAAICPNPQFLRKLLQIFTDVINVEDSLMRKPIHYAALANTCDNLAILLKNGAELRDSDRRRMTPLMLACAGGFYYNVEYILEKCRDPNYVNSRSDEGYSALHYAVLNSHIECLQLLLNDPYVDVWGLTKERADVFHLVAGTGNLLVLDMLLRKQILPYASQDKFKRSPAMIAIRNNNNDCLVKLVENGCKLDKMDSSNNSLLHYAAAYGNIQAIVILKDHIGQTKNKKGLYPWEIAIFKGHLGAARLLEQQENEELQFGQDPLYTALSRIRGSKQYMQCVEYIADNMMEDIYFQDKNTGNGYLHLVCQLNLQQYLKVRKQQSFLSVQEIKQQFYWIERQLIDFFVERGLDGYSENYNHQTPLKLCIQNNIQCGVQKLLTGRITFDHQPSSSHHILFCLTDLACRGLEEMKFVEKKLRECGHLQLKNNLKKVDHNGFDFLLYFVHKFTDNCVRSFRKMIKRHSTNSRTSDPNKKALEEFIKFQQRFLAVVDLLLEHGCDVNALVSQPRNTGTQYRKWGVQHFIMRFPSLKLFKFFKSRVRDFNLPNSQQQTPLHLFCQIIKTDNILEVDLQLPSQYVSVNILQYLLNQGLNPLAQNSTKALPYLYASKNGQLAFMQLLQKQGSPVNFCSTLNEVPCIQVIKQSKQISLDQLQKLLEMGLDPNFLDLNKRSALHHLVFQASSLDSSPQVCRLLVEKGARINALDKYERSPIFYCFCDMEEGGEEAIHKTLIIRDKGGAIQKVPILQVLINHKDINLNLIDAFQRTLLHYACEHNHFFSILRLLDKNINLQAQDYQHNTPLAVCLRARNLDQAALIISKGVKYGTVHQQGEVLSYFGYAFAKLSAGICFMLLDNGYPIQKALEELPNSGFKDRLIQKYILRA